MTYSWNWNDDLVEKCLRAGVDPDKYRDALEKEARKDALAEAQAQQEVK
jgi:hypothetical protein